MGDVLRVSPEKGFEMLAAGVAERATADEIRQSDAIAATPGAACAGAFQLIRADQPAKGNQ